MQYLRNIIFKGLYHLGIAHLLQRHHQRKGFFPIVLFHRVHPQYDAYTEPLSPEAFEEMIRLLCKHYTPVSLDALSHPESLPHNACCVVFDDGMQDFADYAWPILQRYGVPVTMFLPTAMMESHTTLWSYRLFAAFLACTDMQATIRLKGWEGSWKVDHQKPCYGKVMELHWFLAAMEPQQREKALQQVVTQLGVEAQDVQGFAPLMSWEQLDSLKQQGVHFASHTHSHEYLPSVEDEEALAYEFTESKRILQGANILTMDAVAYPMGGHSDTVMALADQHYQWGFVVEGELCHKSLLKDKPLGLPRINVSDRTGYELLFRVNQLHNLLKVS